MGMTFEEYVMFSMLTEGEKRALAEKFALKRLSREQQQVGTSLGTSPVSAWAEGLV